MSLPAIDPANLPVIPLNVRRWIYAVFLILVVIANSIDAFFDVGDPWWLAGVLRVLSVLGGAVTVVALINARPSAGEARALTNDRTAGPTPRLPDPYEG